jgi:hypothetical protein
VYKLLPLSQHLCLQDTRILSRPEKLSGPSPSRFLKIETDRGWSLERPCRFLRGRTKSMKTTLSDVQFPRHRNPVRRVRTRCVQLITYHCRTTYVFKTGEHHQEIEGFCDRQLASRFSRFKTSSYTGYPSERPCRFLRGRRIRSMKTSRSEPVLASRPRGLAAFYEDDE